jgi:hypothetical protein
MSSIALGQDCSCAAAKQRIPQHQHTRTAFHMLLMCEAACVAATTAPPAS